MNRQNPTDSSSGADPKIDPKTAFQKLFTAGVIGWFIGSIILFGLAWPVAHPDSSANAVLWAVSHWWAACAVGLVTMVAFGLATRLPIALAAATYMLPVALLTGIAWVCLQVYPDSSFRSDLFVYLPVVLIFYILALLWMSLRSEVAQAPLVAKALIPTVVGGLVIIGFVAVPVFASDAFRYHDAFQLTISKMTLKDGVILSEGSVQILKPGTYEFVSPRYISDRLDIRDDMEAGFDIGTLTWGSAGVPKANVLGVFPFQVVWRKEVLPNATNELSSADDYICVEVRSPEKDNKLIYSLNAPVVTH